jgi:uncharacterized membrane protein YjjP (DUF1212 family)
MRSGHGLTRWVAGGVIAAGTAGAVLALADIETPLRVPLVLVFLAGVPALAVASLLGGIGSYAQVVVAGSASIVIDIMVAEAMILSGTWSPRTGLVAVAVVSVMIAACRPLVSRSSQPRAARDT